MVACPEILQPWWQWHPPVGVCIALLGALGVLVPWFRGGQSLSPREKAFWTFLMFLFVGLEIRTLYLDRDEHDAEQSLARCRELEQFKAIANGLDTAISNSKTQFDSTLTHVDGVLKTTQRVATTAVNTLNNLTGGDSVAYLTPGVNDGNAVPMLIVNSGSYPLTGVTVVVTDVTTFPFRVVPTLFVGTLASHAIRPIGMDLTPIPGSNPRGVASFTVDIYSQNSTSRQLLQFRKGKRMFWDYRSSMSREVPALHSMIPNHPKPKSDIPGFTFTYGWIEDRKAAHK